MNEYDTPGRRAMLQKFDAAAQTPGRDSSIRRWAEEASKYSTLGAHSHHRAPFQQKLVVHMTKDGETKLTSGGPAGAEKVFMKRCIATDCSICPNHYAEADAEFNAQRAAAFRRTQRAVDGFAVGTAKNVNGTVKRKAKKVKAAVIAAKASRPVGT